PPQPDSTAGWGAGVCRYRICWEPDVVVWSVDRTGSGQSYVEIHRQNMSEVGSYDESLCYPYMSFWHQDKPGGWTVDGTPFHPPEGAKGNCGSSGPCYQAFYFQSLKFTPSS